MFYPNRLTKRSPLNPLTSLPSISECLLPISAMCFALSSVVSSISGFTTTVVDSIFGALGMELFITSVVPVLRIRTWRGFVGYHSRMGTGSSFFVDRSS